MSRIEKHAAFDFIRYANCWEDADVLTQALALHAPQGRVLSIGSAGDNVLALLTLAPKQIVAIDLMTNPGRSIANPSKGGGFPSLLGTNIDTPSGFISRQ